jgi:hypothetical protein
LALNFDEVETVERELSSYDHHSHSEEIRSARKKPLLLTKPPEKEPKDIDSVVKLVKKLSNEVVDLKKNVGEGSSRPRTFHPFFKRNDNPPRPPEAPQIALNLDSFDKDNLCSYHQQNHSEKTCPQWVNSMTLVINQLLDQQSLNDEQPSDIVNDDTTEEPPPEVVMFLWDWCIDSDDEKIEEIFVENTPVVKVVPRDYNLHNKGPVPNTSSSQDANVPLRKITPPIPTPKPSIPTQNKRKK